jgi:hypothetical protein
MTEASKFLEHFAYHISSHTSSIHNVLQSSWPGFPVRHPTIDMHDLETSKEQVSCVKEKVRTETPSAFTTSIVQATKLILILP